MLDAENLRSSRTLITEIVFCMKCYYKILLFPCRRRNTIQKSRNNNINVQISKLLNKIKKHVVKKLKLLSLIWLNRVNIVHRGIVTD